MEIKNFASIKGTALENEDRVGHYGNYFWVIDGATDLFHSKDLIGYSVAEVMQSVSETIPNYCDDKLTLTDILHRALKQVADNIGQEKLSAFPAECLPSFSVAFCRLINGQLDYFLLGDCYLLINQDILTDDRVTNFFNRSVQLIQEGLLNQENIDRKAIFRQVRSLLNRPDGYWIGSLDRSGLNHAIVGSRFLLPGDKILLMSDGFYEDYSKTQDRDIDDLIKQRSSGKVDPVFGKRDDASIISILA